jgi:hypothetical protein
MSIAPPPEALTSSEVLISHIEATVKSDLTINNDDLAVVAEVYLKEVSETSSACAEAAHLHSRLAQLIEVA